MYIAVSSFGNMLQLFIVFCVQLLDCLMVHIIISLTILNYLSLGVISSLGPWLVVCHPPSFTPQLKNNVIVDINLSGSKSGGLMQLE